MKKLIFILPKHCEACIKFIDYKLKYHRYSDIGDSTLYYHPNYASGWHEVYYKSVNEYEFKQLMKEYVP